MFVSKPGNILFASLFALAAAPAMAGEGAPLDDAALDRVTALGMGDIAMPVWLPEPGYGVGVLPVTGMDTEYSAQAGGIAGSSLQSGRSILSLEREDGRGGFSRIFETAVIDLPRADASRTIAGMALQSGVYEAGGGQSATNLAVAATFNGLWSSSAARP